MFKQFVLFSVLIFVSVSSAQNHVDALRYSLFDNYSTARISSLGGAFGSLGGNMGAISINPATLGTYRTDEVSISFTNDNESIQSSYLDKNNTVDRYKPFLQNVGYVKSIPIVENESGWNRLNMSISLNRIRDLSREIKITGHNTQSSMANLFLANSQGMAPDELNGFTDYLAFWTYLIDTVPEGPNTSYMSNAGTLGENQYLTIDEDGFINEVNIACSGSYKDFMFIGASIGITEISFSQHSLYSEDSFTESEDNLESFVYNQHLHVTGEGINFKIGTILKPVPFIRIGWAYHSKTYTSLEENYETYMNTTGAIIDGEELEAFSGLNYFNYELNTPAKLISSLALVFAKNGLITFDYEIIDYGSSNLYSDIYNFNQENQNISDFYSTTNNKKIGIEWRVNKIGKMFLDNFSLRAGYAVFGSPFNDNLNDGGRNYISGGLGFQKGPYFFDIAMINSLEEEDYILYQDDGEPQTANLKNEGQTLIITCSYKF